MPRLPPELGDHIIDFLHSDPDALQACSLVCKDWLPASRLYYPGTLSIDQDNVQALADLLSHPLSTFDKSYSMVEIWTGCSNPCKGNREVNVLDMLAVHLHKIKTRSLILSGGARQKPVQVHGEHEGALSNWLARITNLQLMDIELYHIGDIYTCCPLLECLTFVTIVRRLPYATGLTPNMYPPHLHTLRISFEATVILPYWLRLSRGLRPIDRLELYTWDRGNLSVLAFMMGRLELPAYNIYIAFRTDPREVFSRRGWYWRQFEKCFNRSQFTELRSVQIHFSLEPSDLCPDLELARIREFMPVLDSRKILELSVSFVALKFYTPQNRDVHFF